MKPMNMPPDVLAKKPPPLFCIARDRESGKIQLFGRCLPTFEGASGERKRSAGWWRYGYWTYKDHWGRYQNWDIEREVKKRSYWQDYKEIKAETEEQAVEQYKLEIGH